MSKLSPFKLCMPVMLSALVRRRLLSLTPRESCLLLAARPSAQAMMLGPRTRSGSRDNPQPQRMASSGKEASAARGGSQQEVEMTNLQQNAHKVSERNSSLEKSMRTELSGKSGALEVSQQLPASKGVPAFPLLG